MLLFFSDIDGTILDDKFSFDISSAGIYALKNNNIILIPVSAKSFDEIVSFSNALGITSPFAFENGAGIAYPIESSEKKDFRIELCGNDLNILKKKFSELNILFSKKLKPMYEMNPEEIAGLTGLDFDSAKNSGNRLASIPFINTINSDINISEKINFFLVKNLLKIEKGKKLYYLQNSFCDKGNAVKKILNYYRVKYPFSQISTVCTGDSLNDSAMFDSVDTAFCVNGNLKGIAKNSGLTFTNKNGPEGFNEAVFTILNKELFYAG